MVVLGDETDGLDEAEDDELMNRRTEKPGGDGEVEGECIGSMALSKERGRI